MKREMVIWGVMAVAALLCCEFCIAGGLEPPGPPTAGTMKTLDQVEPRRPVQSLGGNEYSLYVITEPGSYYLTGNIMGREGRHGIEIQTDNVNLDLCGFSLLGQPGAAIAIVVTDHHRNIVIENGFIDGWNEGVIGESAQKVVCRNVHVANVNIRAFEFDYQILYEGCSAQFCSIGFIANESSIIKDCMVRDVGQAFLGFSDTTFSGCSAGYAGGGIRGEYNCRITDCTAKYCEDGIYAEEGAVIERCAVSNCFTGIRAGNFSLVNNCSAQWCGKEFGKSGIRCELGCVVSGSTVSNCWIGISVVEGATVVDCTARNNGEAGIVGDNHCLFMRCTVDWNDVFGLWVRDKSIVKDCVVANNGNAGITVRCCGQGCRIESNLSCGNLYGIILEDDGTGRSHNHIVLKNTCRDNGTNYSLGSGNAWGPIVDVAGAGDISTVPNADHPWANFEY